MAGSGIDTSILHKGAHSASYFHLTRSMGEDAEIVDFCIPCNPYFPAPAMFDELSRDLRKRASARTSACTACASAT